MEDPHNSWVPESNRSAQKLYTDVTINLRVGENLNSFSRQAESSRANLAPVLFIFVIHAVSTLSTRNGISQPLTLDGFRTLKLEASREDNYAEPITPTRAQCSFFKSYYVDDTAFILLSREVIAASSLSSLTFDVLSDYSHWK
jgi:hypothetical protein